MILIIIILIFLRWSVGRKLHYTLILEFNILILFECGCVLTLGLVKPIPCCSTKQDTGQQLPDIMHCLRRFRDLAYTEHLAKLDVAILELRRLHLDLIYCCKIVFGLVKLEFSDFLKVSLSPTRGMCINYTNWDAAVSEPFFFACKVINVWNSLPDVVNFTGLSTFKRFIGMVDFHEFLMCNNECTIVVVSCIVRITSQRHSTGNPTLSCACIEYYLYLAVCNKYEQWPPCRLKQFYCIRVGHCCKEWIPN